MGIFSRKRVTSASPVVPTEELRRLPDIGRAVYLEGQPCDVSAFYLDGFIAAGTPSTDSSAFHDFLNRFLEELLDAAVQDPDGWALAGALRVAVDFVGSGGMTNPRFVELVDRALSFMASAGVSTLFIPNFLLERWGTSQ